MGIARWLDRDLSFCLVGCEGAKLLGGLKAALTRGSNALVICSPGVVANEAVCAFLALLITRAGNWFLNQHQEIPAGGQVRWSYHFGFPAASLDNAPLRTCYQQCVSAALRLASDGSFSLTAVRAALASFANASMSEMSSLQGALCPEVAAAVASFAHTQRRDDGLYALIDVGAGTLDCCTFNLSKKSGGVLKCPIFAADVDMLGVEPWLACRDIPEKRSHFRKELDRKPRTVIWRTRQWRYPDSPRWRLLFRSF